MYEQAVWPDLDDEGEAKWREHKGEGRYIELSRGPFATTRTPTYGTNNRINFAVGRVPLYYMEMRQERRARTRNKRSRRLLFLHRHGPIDWACREMSNRLFQFFRIYFTISVQLKMAASYYSSRKTIIRYSSSSIIFYGVYKRIRELLYA